MLLFLVSIPLSVSTLKKAVRISVKQVRPCRRKDHRQVACIFCFKGRQGDCLERKRKGVRKTGGKGIRFAGNEKCFAFKTKGVVRPVRIMIIGVPNSGKSSIINLLSGRKSAVTGNKPGVTRGKQWIRLGDGLELLDTPGTLWSRFENQCVAQNLFLSEA